MKIWSVTTYKTEFKVRAESIEACIEKAKNHIDEYSDSKFEQIVKVEALYPVVG
jgi:predicted nuclease of restriction endonuclease-like RecB superfamily